MFEVTVEAGFSSGHYLRNYQGKCENPHGHNYRVLVTLAGAELESKAHAAGATAMTLHVFTGNAGAIQFYESIGYGRLGRAEAFYGRGLDALVYRKRFEG